MMARKLVVQKQQQREQQQEQKSAALAASATLTQAKSFERSKLIYNAKLLSPRPPAF